MNTYTEWLIIAFMASGAMLLCMIAVDLMTDFGWPRWHRTTRFVIFKITPFWFMGIAVVMTTLLIGILT